MITITWIYYYYYLKDSLKKMTTNRVIKFVDVRSRFLTASWQAYLIVPNFLAKKKVKTCYLWIKLLF